MNVKTKLAKVVKYSHFSLGIFIVFGFLIPKKYLIFHIVFWPLLVIHWKTNNNKCVLTQVEHFLNDTKETNDEPFILKHVKNFGFNVTEKFVDKMMFMIFTIPWLFTCWRLFKDLPYK
jgi:hypothetical protein